MRDKSMVGAEVISLASARVIDDVSARKYRKLGPGFGRRSESAGRSWG